MAEAGCAIQPTAIFKIEKGKPRRRAIYVDELMALARVFDISIDDLLSPVDLFAGRM